MANPAVVIADLSGGRNGVDSPIHPSFPPNQSVEAVNVDYLLSPCGRKRPGSDNVDLTGGTAFSNAIQFINRYLPSGDEASAELWAWDSSKVLKRLAGGVVWRDLQLADAITGNVFDATAITLNGKHYLFYKSGQNRAHCYDPSLGTPNKVRRLGLATPTAAPTAAQFGLGTYGTLRYARIRWLRLNPLTNAIVSRSEASASVSLTPVAAAGWRITRPALPGEDETHWEIEVSSDNLVWYRLYGAGGVTAGAAVSALNTFQDDATAVSGITSYDVADAAGTYTVFPSAKFAITDNNRIIAAGSHETTSETHESRIWLSPVLGSLDAGDDERYLNRTTQKLIIDLNENDGGKLTGLGGCINGVFWAFKYRRIVRCTPTSDVNTPYLTRTVSMVIGSVNHQGIVMAEDYDGNPIVYFMSAKGPYGIGPYGLLRYNRDIEDVWFGRNGYAGVNLGASMPAYGVYDVDVGQVVWWIAENGSGVQYPTRRIRLDVANANRRDRYGMRGGWQIDDGDASAGWCATMFANTLGASMSRDLKPYLGRNNTKVYKCRSDSAKDDAGTAYRAFQKTRSLIPPQYLGGSFTFGDPTIVASPSDATELDFSIIRDFAAEKDANTIDLSAESTETKIVRTPALRGTSDVGVMQIIFGDVEALSSSWIVDCISIPLEDAGSESA